jgi:hypothetical protein
MPLKSLKLNSNTRKTHDSNALKCGYRSGNPVLGAQQRICVIMRQDIEAPTKNQRFAFFWAPIPHELWVQFGFQHKSSSSVSAEIIGISGERACSSPLEQSTALHPDGGRGHKLKSGPPTGVRFGRRVIIREIMEWLARRDIFLSVLARHAHDECDKVSAARGPFLLKVQRQMEGSHVAFDDSSRLLPAWLAWSRSRTDMWIRELL